MTGIDHFLRLRRVMKLISTYGASLADFVHPVDGAIHSDLKIGDARIEADIWSNGRVRLLMIHNWHSTSMDMPTSDT